MKYNPYLHIKKINPMEHIQRRPGMYIGGTGKRALHHLIYESIDFMRIEVLMGHSSYIQIELHDNNQIVLRDNGLGISMDSDYTSPMEAYVEQIQADITQQYNIPHSLNKKVISSLNSLGLTVVNALSQRFTFENYRDGKLWKKSYKKGKATTPLTCINDAKSQATQGLILRFSPNYDVFDDEDFDIEWILEHAEHVARLTPSLRMTVRDERTNHKNEHEFYYENGLIDWFTQYTQSMNMVASPIHIKEKSYYYEPNNQKVGFDVEIIVQACESGGNLTTFVNTVQISDGTHVHAIKSGILGWVNFAAHYIGMLNDIELKENVTWDDITDKLYIIIALYHPYPQIIEHNLDNHEIFGTISGLIYSHLHRRNYHRHKLESVIRHLIAKES